jgi:hypothetical protein
MTNLEAYQKALELLKENFVGLPNFSPQDVLDLAYFLQR